MKIRPLRLYGYEPVRLRSSSNDHLPTVMATGPQDVIRQKGGSYKIRIVEFATGFEYVGSKTERVERV